MGYLEDILETFGFTQDSTVVAIFCILVLLGNFTGGLMANIFVAFGGPIAPRKITERTSFRLAMVSELILLLYIGYYHSVLVSGIETAQLIYWGFTLLAALSSASRWTRGTSATRARRFIRRWSRTSAVSTSPTTPWSSSMGATRRSGATSSPR